MLTGTHLVEHIGKSHHDIITTSHSEPIRVSISAVRRAEGRPEDGPAHKRAPGTGSDMFFDIAFLGIRV